jgi:hypothetical protein
MEDGAPRYVGRTSDEVSYCFKQHVTPALEKEPSSVYDWMRDVWRCGFDVGVHTLQRRSSPKIWRCLSSIGSTNSRTY